MKRKKTFFYAIKPTHFSHSEFMSELIFIINGFKRWEIGRFSVDWKYWRSMVYWEQFLVFWCTLQTCQNFVRSFVQFELIFLLSYQHSTLKCTCKCTIQCSTWICAHIYAHQCKWNWNTITIKHCVHESLESEAQEALLCWWWEMKRIKNKTHENGSGGGGVGIQHRESIELTYNWKRIKCDPLAVLCCAVLHSEFGSMQMEGKEKQHQHQQEYVVKTFFWKNCSCT